VILTYAGLGGASANTISIYPNPVKDVINLVVKSTKQAAATGYTINITTSNGHLVRTYTIIRDTWQGNLAALIPGTYIISVISNADGAVNGTVKFSKL
jgi:flagellar hook assembly protein FlgD